MANARERADWPESHAEPSGVSATPDTTPKPASDAHSGPHAVVEQILGMYRAAIRSGDAPDDLAARYAAAVLRWAAAHGVIYHSDGMLLRNLADELDPKETTDDAA